MSLIDLFIEIRMFNICASDLNTIVCECEKLLRDNFGSRRSLSRITKVDKVKESIRELRDDVRDAYLRYLVSLRHISSMLSTDPLSSGS